MILLWMYINIILDDGIHVKRILAECIATRHHLKVAIKDDQLQMVDRLSDVIYCLTFTAWCSAYTVTRCPSVCFSLSLCLSIRLSVVSTVAELLVNWCRCWCVLAPVPLPRQRRRRREKHALDDVMSSSDSTVPNYCQRFVVVWLHTSQDMHIFAIKSVHDCWVTVRNGLVVLWESCLMTLWFCSD